jgi:hypothetical protein
MKCPNCKSEIVQQDINIQADIAQCVSCSTVFIISSTFNSSDNSNYLFDNQIEEGFELSKPPSGAWVKKGRENLIVGATTRSAIAFVLVPFMLVWSGGSIGGIYGTQVVSGEFSLFMSLFGIPFLIGSVIFWKLAFMAIWGKVVVTLDKEGGTIFTGIGSLGKTKKFVWSDISSVKEETSICYNRKGSRATTKIYLEGQKRVGFGSPLSEERRYYVLQSIKRILNQVNSGEDFIRATNLPFRD